MITITQGPATFQRQIVKWIEEVPGIPAVFDEHGNVTAAAVPAVPAYLDRPTNPGGSPQMENCPFIGFLIDDGTNTFVCDSIKAVPNGNNLDIYANGGKLTSYPNTAENIAVFEEYLSDGVQTISSTRAERAKRIAIGKEVMDQYLDDNEGLELTTEQSLAQLQKFMAIKALLEVGTLSKAQVLLIATPVDEIFTQARKDKYLAALS